MEQSDLDLLQMAPSYHMQSVAKTRLGDECARDDLRGRFSVMKAADLVVLAARRHVQKFTVAPEFNQTLTIQPDGYVMLKDAGMVEAQGLNLAQFIQAVLIP